MKLKLEVSLDNADAVSFGASEDAQSALAYVFNHCQILRSGRVMDGDGNTIGKAKMERDIAPTHCSFCGFAVAICVCSAALKDGAE